MTNRAENSQDFSESEIKEWFEEESGQDAHGEQASGNPLSEKYARSQVRVVRETKDYSLDYLRYALRPGEDLIEVDPIYQRRLRWSRPKKSLFIESFLLNIPIPAIYLYEKDYNEYEVIDGRQRLESIRDYLTNNLALTGLEYWPELNGKRFGELPSVLQKGLLRRSLPAVVLLAETRKAEEDDLNVRTVLFDRLNTGGEKLNPQELRNALYSDGAFNRMLIELARSSPFTTAWNIPHYQEGEDRKPSPELENNTLFRTMADVELVLRFFAIRDAIENDRRGSLRRILDRYMAAHYDDSPEAFGGMKREYTQLLQRWVVASDGAPFRLPNTNRPSRPLYDALMIALSQSPKCDLERRRAEVSRRLEAALGNRREYDILVGRGNTIASIKERIALAVRVIGGE